MGDPDGVELDEFTSIEDEAAEVLSKHQGELCLIECRFISTSAIELLSRRTGSLILGLETLSDSEAESLSKTRGDLELFNLEELSDSAAESLSNHEGILALGNELEEDFSDSAAESLSNHKGDLTLGLATLSNNTTRSLSKHKYCLYFPNMKSFTCVEKARILLNHSGGLGFRDDIILSKGVKEELRHYSNKINLEDPKAFIECARDSIIDVVTMKWFIDNGGESLFHDENDLRIELHTEITDEAAELLASQDLAAVGQEIPGTNWGFNNSVPLYGIEELSDKAKEVLSKWGGVICDLPAKEWVESLKNNE